jgi:hypothetical protein
MSASKCSPEAPEFKWSPELYATDSRSQEIFRKNETIKTSDAKFDDFICLKADEIPKAKKAAYDVINQCETWKKTADMEAIQQQLESLE